MLVQRQLRKARPKRTAGTRRRGRSARNEKACANFSQAFLLNDEEALVAARAQVHLSQRRAQILMRIHRRIVDANFVMHVRASAASAKANIADRVAATDMLPGGDRKC